MRVVLQAEGSGETGGVLRLLPSPGSTLSEEHLGAGHLLVRRAICGARQIEQGEIAFECPSRLPTGRSAQGGDLLNPKVLRRLLTWFPPSREPDLAVVLIDQDGRRERKEEMSRALSDPALPVDWILAVAIQEFEAWLIADHAAVQEVLGQTLPQGAAPESLAPVEAKDRLRGWIRARRGEADDSRLRREIAARCDLSKLSRTCRSFEDFLSALRHSDR